MTFQESEKQYKELEAQHAAGKLSDADFESKVNDLRLQDAQGRWWQIGVQSGDWYVNDGQRWVKSTPPSPSAETAVPVDAEKKEEPAAAVATGASMPLRQIFSSKPTGRANGGLPLPVFIGIIVVVALLGAGLIFGGYLFFTGQLGGATARATTTPTRVAALPTLALPTAPPTAAPTNPPLAPPTIEITATAVITRTATRAVAAPTRTPTRAPAPAGPTATPTISAPPGLYVTNIVPDPNPPGFGIDNPIGFRVTFFNTIGFRTLAMKVKVFQPENQVRSTGETKQATFNVPSGVSDIVFERTWTTGRGTCDFYAEVYYLDAESTGQLIAITRPDGKRGIFAFKMAC